MNGFPTSDFDKLQNKSYLKTARDLYDYLQADCKLKQARLLADQCTAPMAPVDDPSTDDGVNAIRPSGKRRQSS